MEICISFTDVSSYGNFGHGFGHGACPLGVTCFLTWGKVLAPLGHDACPFFEVLLCFPMDCDSAISSAKNNQKNV